MDDSTGILRPMDILDFGISDRIFLCHVYHAGCPGLVWSIAFDKSWKWNRGGGHPASILFPYPPSGHFGCHGNVWKPVAGLVELVCGISVPCRGTSDGSDPKGSFK